MESVEVLKRQRASVKAKITRIESFADSVSDHVDLNDALVRLSGLEAAWRDYEKLHSQLLTSCQDDEQETHEVHFCEVEEKYYKTKAKLNRFIDSVNARGSGNEVSTLQPTTPASDVKLPRIQLPVFSGNFLEWSSFRDLFTNIVHNSASISASQKLHYLKSSLSGEAAGLLQSMDVTDANYTQAWDLLNDRYQNKRQLIQCHLKALFGQTALHSESVSGLRRLIDTTVKHKRALTALGVETEHWDQVLVFFLAEKLDAETRREWELSNQSKDYPSFKSLKDYLEGRCCALENSAVNKTRVAASVPGTSVRTSSGRGSMHALHAASSCNPKDCTLCGDRHPLYKCRKFLEQRIEERKDAVRHLVLCFNCLNKGHLSKHCPSAASCHKCKSRHHTLLHYENGNHVPQNTVSSSESTPLISHCAQPTTTSRVILSTALVEVCDSANEWQKCRILLDSGSQASFITESCISRLGLKRSKANIIVEGIGRAASCTTRGVVTLKIRSRNQSFELAAQTFVMNKLSSYKLQTATVFAEWAQTKNITLADSFVEPHEIDIILGADYFSDILEEGRMPGSHGWPAAFNTKFGWVLSGRLVGNEPAQMTIHVNHANFELQQQLQKFWEMEELPQQCNKWTVEEEDCEAQFISTFRKEPDGHYCVRLPFKKDKPILGQSRDIALKRLEHLDRKLSRNPELKEQYSEFLKEYLALGHMELVPRSEQNGIPPHVNYIPHHAVSKPDSTTTSLRVVFDASSKSTTGVSLNDCLLVGPKTQQDIWDVLLRFRLHAVAIVADIAKMFRQIWIDKPDTDLQRILWFNSVNGEIQEFRLKTVTYGTAAAPYLANRTLQQLAYDEGQEFPLAARAVLQDFYVDDFISGTESVDEAIQLQKQLVTMLQRGGFVLRKWASNVPSVLEALPEDSREREMSLSVSDGDFTKTLGLHWQPKDDQFFFTVKCTKIPTIITKREILSEISKLYDPLGWLAPIVIVAKILIQHLWTTGVSWDERLPSDIEAQWLQYYKSLSNIQHILIPRYIGVTSMCNLQIHGFCDASEQAYGAVIYARCTKLGTTTVRLLCAKSRVAPLKQITIPKLELCAALLLAKLLHRVHQLLGQRADSVHAWTDSSVCLAWIRKPSRTWKTFVANRVATIQQLLPPCHWRHVSSGDNPADLVSRGTTVTKLADSTLWWSGPTWLQLEEAQWPLSEKLSVDIPKELMEQRVPKMVATAVLVNQAIVTNVPDPQMLLVERYSSLTKLKRITAWCLRFLHNVRHPPKDRLHGMLSAKELQHALLICVRQVQRHTLSDTITAIQNGQLKSSRLASLKPYIDGEGILRVGGRLQKARLPFNQRSPMLLPKHHHFVELVVRDAHIRLLHAGPQTTLANILQMFWIVNGRDVVRRILHKCHICIRDRGAVLQQEMGNLPQVRTEPARPFQRCGVDYGGPFSLKLNKGRGGKTCKAYFALFICLTTKAVHLEPVGDLSTEAFLASFRRFTARRGLCTEIFSDNGTNFIGADRVLKELSQFVRSKQFNTAITNTLAEQNIQWHFIPPSAPHFGGLWEAGIKSAKTLLRRVVGDSLLTFEEFATVLAQIEAILNSRPLCALSSSPDDLQALTPGHFLIGEALTAPPDQELTQIKLNRLNRWQLIQQISQRFWQRWKLEYLSQLHKRTKWSIERDNIQVGDLVIIKNEHSPPLKWPKGRIVALHPGSDNKVRVVTVKTSSGILKRPIVKLCRLPIT